MRNLIKTFFTIVLAIAFTNNCAIISHKPKVVPASLLKLSSDVHQALIVHEADDWRAVLSAWQREGATWHLSFKPMQAVIGRNGFARAGEKREGDGQTPTGIYAIRRAFGYPENISTSLLYRQATDNDFWVDDYNSAQYNQWVEGAPQAKSFERLKRDDDLYKYAIVIEYNTDPMINGYGSAIFLHIWRDRDHETSGCVAVSEENILKLLSWLSIDQNPMIVLNPS
ncbi:MAG TPA: L,D-transpeptidase family protein [Candidatus Omnitrophota bacterium]|nr:L,D-transpeptidase family protein [Candidatus Omnitrophota bacterium]